LVAHASNNFDFIRFIVVDSGGLIDDAIRFQQPMSSSFLSFLGRLAAGDYDIYLTGSEQTDILAGPIPLNIVLGDVVDIMIFDDPADPAVLDLQFLSAP
jgi:hypothetical protein